MPGTVIRDSIAPDLLDGATLNSATTSQGTTWTSLWPGEVQFYLDISTVTGTSPTLTIDIEGSENSDFSTENVVTLGTITAGDEADNTVLAFTTHVDAKFVRANVTVGGTTPVYTATLTPVPPQDRRVRGSHPTAQALA